MGGFQDFSLLLKATGDSRGGEWDLPAKEAFVFLSNDWIANQGPKLGLMEPLRGEN